MWIYTSTPIRLHGVVKHNFTYTPTPEGRKTVPECRVCVHGPLGKQPFSSRVLCHPESYHVCVAGAVELFVRAPVRTSNFIITSNLLSTTQVH
jgi:hypothetical protein